MSFNKFEKKLEKKVLPYFDVIFYLGGIASPIVGLPQAFTIFHYHTAAGVSLFSWVMYLLGAIGMLIYGILHKQNPIIFMHVMVIPVYSAIIVGVLLYN
jgi:uncharacterized protein with PQ loop repeat